MKELIRRVRENKYLTRNETDFIIKALEENSSLRKQVNMWQSEHAKRVLELGKLRENIKDAREEISDWNVNKVMDGCSEPFKLGVARGLDIASEILDKLIESEEK